MHSNTMVKQWELNVHQVYYNVLPRRKLPDHQADVGKELNVCEYRWLRGKLQKRLIVTGNAFNVWK